jgi:hypothetical protein
MGTSGSSRRRTGPNQLYGGLKPHNCVAALDPSGGPPPDAARHPVLVKPESIVVAEMFVDLPHQGVSSRGHAEGDTAGFSPG